MPGKRHATEEARREARLASYRRHAAKKRAKLGAYADWPEGIKARCRLDARNYQRRERAKPDHVPHRIPVERRAALDRARNATPEARARRRELQRLRYQRIKNDPVFRAKQRAASKHQYEKNSIYYIAKGAESARRKKRTFGTLSSADRMALEALYHVARRLTEVTGIPHEVDHIEPLRGKHSCGLHVPWNLRVIVAEDNRAKGNRLYV